MSAKSTTKRPKQKPSKPRSDFPLFAHLSGKWAKVIRSKTFYFGKWEDPQGALEEYLDVKDDLHAGRTPQDRSGALTIADLCNAFLRHCKAKVKAGEMVERTYADYVRTTDRIVKVFGKRQSVDALMPNDFARLRADIAATNGLVALSNQITRIRTVFNYAKTNLLIENDVKFGLEFDRPKKTSLRKARAQNGNKMFSAAECRMLIRNAQTPELKAMILLGLNCGFGNSDCAKLPIRSVNLQTGWIDWPRPKTGVDRRCPLWPETVKALQVVLSRRSQPRQLVFVTKYSKTYDNEPACITKEFRKLLDRLELHQKGRGFYSLRHVFRTIADGSKDFVACRAVMGHVDASIDAVYREQIDDSRLLDVVNYVREWLFS